MPRSMLAVMGVALSVQVAHAQAPAATVAYATKQLQPMINPKACQPATYAGWPDGLVKRCDYQISDTTKQNPRVYKTVAWLADPTPRRAAEWAWTACTKASPAAPAACAIRVIDRMKCISSAAQFPVSGLYYEDLDRDGRLEAYFFREGVTTRLVGYLKLNGQIWPAVGSNDIAEAEASAGAAIDGMRTGKARPVAVYPEEYRTASGDPAIPPTVATAAGAKAWADLVRSLTIKALTVPESGAENPLVTAWARAHVTGPVCD